MDLGSGRIVPRKRRHGNSTDSSIIQFAKPDFINYDKVDNDDDDVYEVKRNTNKNDNVTNKGQENAGKGNAAASSSSSSDATELSWSVSPPRQRQPAQQKIYERQPRRKMREGGRVEIELARETSRRQKEAEKSYAGKEKKTRKERAKKAICRSKGGGTALGERSSNILHQAFESERVTKDRLTLRPSLGLFKKGRASLPTRGLPDLVFSEMQFLGRQSSRIVGPDNEIAPGRKSTEAVSGYFTAPKTKGKQKSRINSPKRGFQRRSIRSKSVATTTSAIHEDETAGLNRFRRHGGRDRTEYSRITEPDRGRNSKAARELASFSPEAASIWSSSRGRTRHHEDDRRRERSLLPARRRAAPNDSGKPLYVPSSNLDGSAYMSSDQADSRDARLRKEHAENVVRSWLEHPEEVSRPFRYPSSEIQVIENEAVGTVAGENAKDIRENFYVDPVCNDARPQDSRTATAEQNQAPEVPMVPEAGSEREPQERDRLEDPPSLQPALPRPSTKNDFHENRALPLQNIEENKHIQSLPQASNLESNSAYGTKFSVPEGNLRGVTAPTNISGHNNFAFARPISGVRQVPTQIPLNSSNESMMQPETRAPMLQGSVAPQSSLAYQYRQFVDRENAQPVEILQVIDDAWVNERDWDMAQQQGDEQVNGWNSGYQQQINQQQAFNNEELLPAENNEYQQIPMVEMEQHFYPSQQQQQQQDWNQQIWQPQITNPQNWLPNQDEELLELPGISIGVGEGMDEDDGMLDDYINSNDSKVADNTPRSFFQRNDLPAFNFGRQATVGNEGEGDDLFQFHNSRVTQLSRENTLKRGFRLVEAMPDDVQAGLTMPQQARLFGSHQDGGGYGEDGEGEQRMFWRPRKAF